MTTPIGIKQNVWCTHVYNKCLCLNFLANFYLLRQCGKAKEEKKLAVWYQCLSRPQFLAHPVAIRIGLSISVISLICFVSNWFWLLAHWVFFYFWTFFPILKQTDLNKSNLSMKIIASVQMKRVPSKNWIILKSCNSSKLANSSLCFFWIVLWITPKIVCKNKTLTFDRLPSFAAQHYHQHFILLCLREKLWKLNPGFLQNFLGL